MSIVTMLVATVLPLNTLLKQERKILQQRRAISLTLHEYIQVIVWENEIVREKTVEIGHTFIHFSFDTEDDLVEGCATWTNEKQRKESLCLYGFKEK